VSENLEQIINDVLSKYGIDYLLTSDKRVRDYQRKRDANKTINEGSRHNELLREMNARLHEFVKRKPLEDIKQMCIEYNNLFCKPPVENKEFEQMWNDSVVYVVEKEGEERQNAALELISVAEAKRRSFGRVAVKGIIVGISSVEHMIMATKFSCSNCGIYEGPIEHTPPLFSVPNQLSLSKCISCGERTYGPSEHQDRPAIKIQVQDEEKQNQPENLDVILFDDDTLNVRNGERAMIFGDLHIVQQNRNSKRVTYLFANPKGGGIEYERPENDKIVVSEEDLVRLNEFVQQPNMIEKLTAIFAPTVIGHEDKKLAVILMYVGAPETQDFRGRIHGLFIGPPGTAKSKLARGAKKLGEPHSRYSSAQGASGKSITAIIDKDGDSYVLRLGVLPQARNSMCVINETSSLSMEDQRYLHDVMEEGFFSIDKYAFHREIEAPTTVLGTTNPEGGEWYRDIVEIGKIPLLKELIDRYDLVMVFESLKDKEKKVEYAKKKLKLLRRNQDNRATEDLEFLRKIIQHAKTFNPQLSEEAEAMIIDYWSGLDIKIFPTNRLLETIVRVSKAFARVHFSDEVNVDITKEALSFITRILKAFDSSVEVVEDPRYAACFAVAEFVMKTPNMPFKFSDCVDYAITSKKLVEAYMGESPVNTDSHKYRDLRERFLQSSP
jgi:DNA replicative helicase MCM subunit Mcm2 (Cdc46/Mcm family)